MSRVEALPNDHPLYRNNRLLSLSVFQRAHIFHPSFPPPKLTEHYCEVGEETYKRRMRKKIFNRPLLGVHFLL